MKKLLLLSLILSSTLFAASSNSKKLAVTTLLGLPHPVNMSLDYKLGSKFSLGVTGGLLGLNLKWSTGDQFKITTQNIEGRLRYHPFGNSFFFGLAWGTQSVTGETYRTISSSGISVDVTARGEISNPYIIPHVGWLSISAKGFVIGVELGAYIPYSAKTDFALTSQNSMIGLVQSTPEYLALQSDIQKFGSDMGNMKLPFITVLRLGWAF